MRHTLTVLAATITAALVAVTPLADAAPAGRALTPTAFGFSGHGYGTRATGGQVPAGSGATGYQVLGCTNLAGKRLGNTQAGVDVPGLGRVSGIATKVRTTKVNGVPATLTRNSIARVHVAGSAGSVNVNAIVSQARAYHDGQGFHATATTDIGSIQLLPPGGLPGQDIPVPSPGQSVDIPGVATIYVGVTLAQHGAHAANARADGLRIVAHGTGSTVKVARAVATIDDSIESGVFSGMASGARARKLAQVGGVGYTPLQKMPCQGTLGRVRSTSIAETDLGGQLVLKGLQDSERASQDSRRAHGYTQGQVASVNLGGGKLVAKGIVGRASVSRVGSHVHRSIKGSTIGSITVNGAKQTFPDSGVLEIPGVVKLQRNVVKRYASGIQVIALRVTVLDGSGGTIDLGQARLRIRPSHR